MPYLIDGHNLIPKVPGLSLHSMDDEVQLIQRLQAFCRVSGKQVDVYFDNAPAGQARTQRYGQVKAHFIRAGRTADAAIVARLRSLGRAAQNWSVVTSDRQVAASARAAHAQVIPSDLFAGYLTAAQFDDGDGGSPETAPDVSLSAGEIDEWMDLFTRGDDSSNEEK